MIDPAIAMEYRHALRLTYLGLQLHFGEGWFVSLSGYRKVMLVLIGSQCAGRLAPQPAIDLLRPSPGSVQSKVHPDSADRPKSAANRQNALISRENGAWYICPNQQRT